jgi:hypothetical protein
VKLAVRACDDFHFLFFSFLVQKNIPETPLGFRASLPSHMPCLQASALLHKYALISCCKVQRI